MRYRTQVLLLVASVAVTCAAVVAWFGYRTARSLLQQTLMSEVRALAIAAAASVDPAMHETVRRAPNAESSEYKRLESGLRQLRNLWRENGIEVRFVYTLASDPRSKSGMVYVIDAEEPGPDKSLPGTPLEGSGGTFPREAYMGATAAFASDERYGDTLTGTAPIAGPDGRVVAIAGVDLPLATIQALNESLAWWGGGALVGAAMVALAAGWILAGRITRPLEHLGRVAAEMADGALSRSAVTGGSKEVTALATSLESLRISLRGIVTRIHEAGICANESCATLNARAVTERDRAREAAANAVDSAGRAGDIATTARTLADAANDLRTTANTIVAAGTEGIENLRNIAVGVAQIQQESVSLEAQLRALRERARAVDGLLQAMVEVADRSNLLSLNAEIEASKAGDAGRGFMVVAGEIRRLAEQAAASSLQIEENVRRMHEAVDAGVRATNQLVEVLARGAERTRHGNELLHATVEGVEGLSPRIAGIAEASVRQREGAEAISKAVGGIAESATNALEFFESVDGMLRDFSRRGTELSEEVKRFEL